MAAPACGTTGALSSAPHPTHVLDQGPENMPAIQCTRKQHFTRYSGLNVSKFSGGLTKALLTL